MSFKLWLYEQWVRFSEYVNGKLGPIYVEYQNAKARAHAEKFLKEFHRTGWQKPAYDPTNPDTWERAYRPFDPKCKHTKGGKNRGTHRDYNLACHRFINGRVKIWCLNHCGYVVWSDGDKAEFVKAWELMEQSSNTVTCSERTVYDPPQRMVVTVQDSIPDGGPYGYGPVETHTPVVNENGRA